MDNQDKNQFEPQEKSVETKPTQSKKPKTWLIVTAAILAGALLMGLFGGLVVLGYNSIQDNPRKTSAELRASRKKDKKKTKETEETKETKATEETI